jgi:hypothetical protein
MGVCALFQHVEQARRVDSVVSVGRSTAHTLQHQDQAVAYRHMSVQVITLVICTILCTENCDDHV